jgi:hypothetical protein
MLRKVFGVEDSMIVVTKKWDEGKKMKVNHE